jgi:hypothetical protein
MARFVLGRDSMYIRNAGERGMKLRETRRKILCPLTDALQRLPGTNQFSHCTYLACEAVETRLFSHKAHPLHATTALLHATTGTTALLQAIISTTVRLHAQSLTRPIASVWTGRQPSSRGLYCAMRLCDRYC